MSFGFEMHVEYNGFGITLRGLRKEEMPLLTSYFQYWSVLRYTNMRSAPSVASEERWWDKANDSKDDLVWAIVPDGQDTPIGVTGLHGIDAVNLTCKSGILIVDSSWWNQGVAGRAHLARTRHAVDGLNRYSISSEVRAPNEASLKALRRVGYRVVGHQRDSYVDGRWIDTYKLFWTNPERAALMHPEGVPDEFAESLEKARIALARARQVVTYL